MSYRKKLKDEAFKLNDIEDYNSENILSQNILNLYNNTKNLNLDFKNNIFFKHIKHISENAGKFDKQNLDFSISGENDEDYLKDIKSQKELLAEYERKANELK
jgi:hypothetical protein